ncbi:MAG: thiol peroxidase [Holophagaceae bacterium]
MATLAYRGQTVHTAGELPTPGHRCPEFTLLRPDLSPLTLSDLAGRRVVLNIFPSLDTTVCARSVLAFDARSGDAPNVEILNVSTDLPFAQRRFAESTDLRGVSFASTFRNSDFGRDFGVLMVDGPLRGLLARAVVVLDERGTVVHAELVPELTCEADYDRALDVLRHPEVEMVRR